jgi:hypothetical protein
MSNRYHSLTVVLSDDSRDDDADALIKAIMMMKGVCAVAGNVADATTYMAEARARREYGDKLWEMLYPKNDKQ